MTNIVLAETGIVVTLKSEEDEHYGYCPCSSGYSGNGSLVYCSDCNGAFSTEDNIVSPSKHKFVRSSEPFPCEFCGSSQTHEEWYLDIATNLSFIRNVGHNVGCVIPEFES